MLTFLDLPSLSINHEKKKKKNSSPSEDASAP